MAEKGVPVGSALSPLKDLAAGMVGGAWHLLGSTRSLSTEGTLDLGDGRSDAEGRLRPRLSMPQILISADDELEESDVEEDLCRLTPLKPGKKKKHRFGLPV